MGIVIFQHSFIPAFPEKVIGPLFQWRTPVYTDGTHLYLQGRGDPRLVNERATSWMRTEAEPSSYQSRNCR